jgi:hypothetical protein
VYIISKIDYTENIKTEIIMTTNELLNEYRNWLAANNIDQSETGAILFGPPSAERDWLIDFDRRYSAADLAESM